MIENGHGLGYVLFYVEIDSHTYRINYSMTDKQKAWAIWCAEHDPASFYKSKAWRQMRLMVLNLDRHECQRCLRVYHRYRPATMVHHVNHFKKRPDIGLCIYYKDLSTGERKRNLISLCNSCHEEVHDHRNGFKPTRLHLTEERWD